MQNAEASDLEKMASDQGYNGSDAALWMLLLLRLTTVTTDDRLELRNSAIHTLLRIFDAYGDRLSPEAWSVCIKSVIFKLFSSIEEELKVTQVETVGETDKAEWNETAVVVLNGISSLLANYLDILTVHESFDDLWRELLGHFAKLLDFQILEINTAAFKALSHVLSQSSDDEKATFNKKTVDFAWDLWARGVPSSKPANDKTSDNQDCLIAYVSALSEVYRLIQVDIDVKRVERILVLLRDTLQEATVSSYVLDIEYVTPLQAHIIEAIQMMRTNIDGVPSAMVKEVSNFITLAFDQETSTDAKPKRTYIALSKSSMQIVENLVLNHCTDKDIYRSGAFSGALSALSRPIGLKYQFPIVTKSVQPWMAATDTALMILEVTLTQLVALDIPRKEMQNIWATIITIANGIVSADCDTAPPGSNFDQDEEYDIQSFQRLRELIIPSLGAEVIPNKTRKAYAESLFKTSIIHAPPPTEESIVNGTHDAGLSALYEPRAGRTVAIRPTQRTRMAYVAFEELFSLISAETATIVVQPPTPISPEFNQSHLNEAPTALRARIASTAAPFLILRSALALRAYIADQPLRGKMPQPLSQRKELLWVLGKLVDLKSESSAIPELSGIESESRKHLLRLYPLIVRASAVAGDEKVLSLLREALEVVGGELGF